MSLFFPRLFERPAFALAAFVAVTCGGLQATRAETSAAPSSLRFNRDIRPILSENCFYCHGQDSGHRKAGLRLDMADGLFGKHKRGVAVVKGKPDESLLVERIFTADEDDLMPPADSHKTLTADQKAILKRWIEQGAEWEPHWSLVAPVRAEPPVVKNTGWAKTPIDRFILARLEEKGLAPAVEADRRTLLRRVSLDLIGLPPTQEEVTAFVADQSPDAYEKVIDQLQASPRYGEHRARFWLDAARYGDTHGIHIDNYNEIWPYRDWVISAFNQNMRFDRFTVEQLAGDLLPNRTVDQQTASGFHRCNITTSEGGSITDEVLAMYAKDRAETTSEVWLGLTAGCAVCHDHKFDPITQKDFYQLTAFFRNTVQPAMDGNIAETPPVIVVPAPEQRAHWMALQKDVAAQKQAIETRRKEASKAFVTWAASSEPRLLKEPLNPESQSLSLGLDEGKSTAVCVARVNGEDRSIPLPAGITRGEGPLKDSATLFGAKAAIKIPGAADFDSDQPFSFSAWAMIPEADGAYVIASKLETKPINLGRGWVFEVVNKTLQVRLLGGTGDVLTFKPAQAGKLRSTKLPTGKWEHLCVTYNGGRTQDSLAVYINGKPFHADRGDETTLKGSIRNAAPLTIGSDGSRFFAGGGLQDVRVYSREITPEEVGVVMNWEKLHQTLAKGDPKGVTAERGQLQNLYLNRFDAAFNAVSLAAAKLEGEMRSITRHSGITQVMQEVEGKEPMAFVLNRGQYDQKKDEVRADTPGALHPFPKDAPHNRLGLAKWLMEPQNTLTARVTVNRMWQEIFGTGLVRTSEDFGIMGENPSHPELLDWLAVEFRESGWDMKHVTKLIVSSAAYRQAAITTSDKLRLDPANRLLSRGPRFRMDAETLRDFALASSGLLSPKIGGPSVKPYQPPGVWEAVAMFGSNTRFYKQDSGESLYRRSMYTFWKRSAPPASMDIFNAPSRENCTLRRERTNTPLQALVTLNDPQWVEAARVLAQRAILDAGSTDFDHRLDFITSRVIARSLEPRERDICRQVFADLSANYGKDAEAAKKLIATGESKPDAKVNPSELAAWTMLTSEVMNLDEALNK